MTIFVFDNQEIDNSFNCHFIAAGNISVSTNDAAGPNHPFFCWRQQKFFFLFFLLTGCYMVVSVCDFLSVSCPAWHPAQTEAQCRSVYVTQPWRSGSRPDQTRLDTYQVESSCNYAQQKEDRQQYCQYWTMETRFILMYQSQSWSHWMMSITGAGFQTHPCVLYRTAGGSSLTQQRKQHSILYIYDMLIGKFLNYLLSTNNLRRTTRSQDWRWRTAIGRLPSALMLLTSSKKELVAELLK